MSLVLSFEICQESNCSGLSFKETTGAYSISNPNGWNAPNATIASATAATLTVTMASGTAYIINLFTSSYPTINTSLVYNILNTSIGLALTDTIPDQIIKFTYSVTTGSGLSAVIYTQTIEQSFYCQVNCCVNSMFTDLDFECDSCNKNIDDALKAFAMLQGLKYNSNCGNSDEFNNILSQLNKLCGSTNCSSCN